MPAPVMHFYSGSPMHFLSGVDRDSIVNRTVHTKAQFRSRSKRADRVKMLVYDGTGLVLIWKRLEGAKFRGCVSLTHPVVEGPKAGLPGSDFVPVVAESHGGSGAAAIEIEIGSAIVGVGAGVELALLGKVLRLLKAIA
jgi:hypothetical protein